MSLPTIKLFSHNGHAVFYGNVDIDSQSKICAHATLDSMCNLGPVSQVVSAEIQVEYVRFKFDCDIEVYSNPKKVGFDINVFVASDVVEHYSLPSK